MKKEEMILVVDTETAMINPTAKVSGCNSLVYDIGLAVANRKGEIAEKRNLVVNDIMFGEYKRMETCYYAEKLPQYYVEMGTGVRQIVSLETARKIVLELMEKYNIKKVAAYNMMFDYYALKKTNEFLGGKFEFFPEDTKYIDILKMARGVFKNNKRYLNYCYENNLLTDNGNPSISAENVYRYITNNPDFVESHTGLKDVEIETEIMAYLNNRKCKLNRKIAFNY